MTDKKTEPENKLEKPEQAKVQAEKLVGVFESHGRKFRRRIRDAEGNVEIEWLD